MLIRTFRSFLITGILYNFNRYFIICFSLSRKLNYVNYTALFNIKPDIRILFIPYKSDHTNSFSERRRHHLIQFEVCCLKIIFGSHSAKKMLKLLCNQGQFAPTSFQTDARCFQLLYFSDDNVETFCLYHFHDIDLVQG